MKINKLQLQLLLTYLKHISDGLVGVWARNLLLNRPVLSQLS